VLSSRDLQQRLGDQGIDLTPSTPEQIVANVTAATAKWKRVLSATSARGRRRP